MIKTIATATSGTVAQENSRPHPRPTDPAPTRRSQSPPARIDDGAPAAAERSVCAATRPTTRPCTASVGRIRPVPNTLLSASAGPEVRASRSRIRPMAEHPAVRFDHSKAARTERYESERSTTFMPMLHHERARSRAGALLQSLRTPHDLCYRRLGLVARPDELDLCPYPSRHSADMHRRVGDGALTQHHERHIALGRGCERLELSLRGQELLHAGGRPVRSAPRR